MELKFMEEKSLKEEMDKKVVVLKEDLEKKKK